MVSDSDAAAQSWKGNPTHGAIHQVGEDAVYSEFHTEVFALDRENHWYRDHSGRAPVRTDADG